MQTNVIASSPNIQGNISNCEIQDVRIYTNRTLLNPIVTETHQVINKCDFSIISEYQQSGLNIDYLVFIVMLLTMYVFYRITRY